MPPPRADRPWRPTREQLIAAAGSTVADVIADDLRVLFCGINPGLYTAAIGHHFGRPGNRFWPLLHAAGFTPRLLSPFEESLLPGMGIGITNLVPRATAAATEVSREELRAGAAALTATVVQRRPAHLGVLGMSAYRTAFAQPRAALGPQPERLGATRVWLLPNPSGLQARYQMPELVTLFSELARAAGFAPPPATGVG